MLVASPSHVPTRPAWDDAPLYVIGIDQSADFEHSVFVPSLSAMDREWAPTPDPRRARKFSLPMDAFGFIDSLRLPGGYFFRVYRLEPDGSLAVLEDQP
jgi:hypothetical protein